MIPLIACLVAVVILAAILAWASHETEKANIAERARLIAIIVAQDVSPQVALSVAKPPKAEPSSPPEPRATPIGL